MVDLTASRALRQLRIIPFLMNQLQREWYSNGSLTWNPKRQQYEAYQDGSKNRCEYINRLSMIDDGNGDCALLIKHEMSTLKSLVAL